MNLLIAILLAIIIILCVMNIYKWLKISVLTMDIEDLKKENEQVWIKSCDLNAKIIKLELIVNKLKSKN